jgi:hypothetical protein
MQFRFYSAVYKRVGAFSAFHSVQVTNINEGGAPRYKVNSQAVSGDARNRYLIPMVREGERRIQAFLDRHAT